MRSNTRKQQKGRHTRKRYKSFTNCKCDEKVVSSDCIELKLQREGSVATPDAGYPPERKPPLAISTSRCSSPAPHYQELLRAPSPKPDLAPAGTAACPGRAAAICRVKGKERQLALEPSIRRGESTALQCTYVLKTCCRQHLQKMPLQRLALRGGHTVHTLYHWPHRPQCGARGRRRTRRGRWWSGCPPPPAPAAAACRLQRAQAWPR